MHSLTTIAVLVLCVVLQVNGDIECATPVTTRSRDRSELPDDFSPPFPVPYENNHSFKVYIKSAGDAYINLVSREENGRRPSVFYSKKQSGQIGTIVLGGWGNMESATYCQGQRQQHWIPTPNLLSANEEKEFEISWTKSTTGITVTVSGANGELLTHTFTCLPNLTHIIFASAMGNDATWRICFGCVDVVRDCDKELQYCKGTDGHSEYIQENCQKSCNLCQAKREEEEKLSDELALLRRLLKESMEADERRL